MRGGPQASPEQGPRLRRGRVLQDTDEGGREDEEAQDEHNKLERPQAKPAPQTAAAFFPAHALNLITVSPNHAFHSLGAVQLWGRGSNWWTGRREDGAGGRARLDLQENLRNLVHRLIHQEGHFDSASILRRLQPFETRGRDWHGGVDLTT